MFTKSNAFTLILAVTLLSSSCKSPFNSLPDSKFGNISLDFSEGARSTVLPPSVETIEIIAKAADMATVKLVLTKPAMAGSMEVPAGSARSFDVLAKNLSGVVIYKGQQLLDIQAGSVHELSVAMAAIVSLVTFDSQGATTAASPATKTVVFPATTVLTLPSIPIKAGFNFVGWYTAPGGGGIVFDASTSVFANIIVYAYWSANPVYTVTFDSQGATTTASPGSLAVTLPATTVVTLPTAPIKTGYTFSGWYTGVSGGGSVFNGSTPVGASLTVYAYWMPLIYTVTFDSQAATVNANPGSSTVVFPSTMTGSLPIPPTKIGNTFSGWYTAVSGGGTVFTGGTPVGANITVYAFWIPITHTVTFDSQGGTAVLPISGIAASTSLGSLPGAPTKTGFSFLGWFTLVNGGGTSFIGSTIVTADITVYACWRPYLYAADNSSTGGLYRSIDFGANWTQVYSLFWASAIASSSDGTKLVASAGRAGGASGNIYTSTDSGLTWTVRAGAGSRIWLDLASSATGQYLIAAPYDGTYDLWTSADYGVNWVSRPTGGAGVGGMYWTQVAISADGSHMSAINGGDAAGDVTVLTSIDYGATWIKSLNEKGALASSADGLRLIHGGGEIGASALEVSTDGGASWAGTVSGNHFWTALAMSDNGMNVVAAAYGTVTAGLGDFLYTSTDGGINWSVRNWDATPRRWSNLASSADGIILSAVVDSGTGNSVWTSIDGGATWVEQLTSGARTWMSVAMTRN